MPPRRAQSYADLTDDQLLCHLGNHALGWPTLWQGRHPTRNLIAWREVRSCARCGTEREEWLQVGAREIRIGSTYSYDHPDGFLMQGGRDIKAARGEVLDRAKARQGIVTDEDDFVIDDAPSNVQRMRRERRSKPAPGEAGSQSG